MSEQPISPPTQQDVLAALTAELEAGPPDDERRRRIQREIGIIVGNTRLSEIVSNDPTGVWAGEEDDANEHQTSNADSSSADQRAQDAHIPMAERRQAAAPVTSRRYRRATAPITTIGTTPQVARVETRSQDGPQIPDEISDDELRIVAAQVNGPTQGEQPQEQQIAEELSDDELRISAAQVNGPTQGTQPLVHEAAGSARDEDSAEEASDVAEDGTDEEDGVPPRLILSFIDQSQDAEDAARLAAEARLTGELNSGGRFRRMIRNAWKGSIAREFYILKYKRQASEQILSSQDIHVHETADRAGRANAQLATIARFESVYDEAVHTDAGERKEMIADDSEFGRGIKDLLRQYVEGGIANPEALEEEKNRLLSRLAENGDMDLLGAGTVRIDNLLGIAASVKGMVEHGQSIDDVLAGMSIYTGEARSNVRTEVDYGRVDRMLEKLQRSKVGSLVGPETLGLAAAAALIATRAGRGSLLRASGVMLIPGVNGAVFGAIRENKRVKEERTQHSREMAQGKVAEGGRRREQMDQTRYETVAAADLSGSLGQLFDAEDALSTPEQVQAAYELLSSVEARIRLSDQNSIDLISYSEVTRIEEERLALDIARARAKVMLQPHLGNLPDEYRSRLGIESSDTVDGAVGRYTSILDTINADVSSKDAAFSKLKRRRVATAAATGFVTSELLSLGTQEGVAFADSSYDGLLENMVTDGDPSEGGRQTVLQGLANPGENVPGERVVAPVSTHENYTLADTPGSVDVSSTHSMSVNEDGTVGFRDTQGAVVIDNLAVNDDGTLPQTTLDALNANDINVIDKGSFVTDETTTTRTVPTNEFVDNHKADTTHIRRELWYDNDTAAPRFEKNELGLSWGGPDNSGVGDDGVVVMSVASMTEDGSYHGLDYTNWQQDASRGELKLAVSASKDTQSDVFMLSVRPDGTIEVPKDSPAAHFFENNDGQMTFNGAYAEVVELNGDTGEHTSVRPLATLVGENSVDTIEDTVVEQTTVFVPNYEINIPTTEIVAAREVESIPMPPIIPRRSLERVLPAQKISPAGLDPFTYAYGGGRSLEDMRKWVVADPSRLRTRRQVETEDGQLRWVENDGNPVERNVTNERNMLNSYLEGQFTAEPQYRQYIQNIADALGPMGQKCRVSVNIPAWMEEKNLRNLLSQYLDQRDKDGNPLDPGLFEVNIIVNRKEGTAPDGSVGVINQFIDQYVASHNGQRPNVRFVDVEFKEEIATVGYARKVLTDAALLRSLSRTDQDQPLYIESEDADLTNVDKRVIANLISKLDRNPHLDAVHGIEGRMPEVIKDNDLLVMRRNAWEVFLLMARQKKFRNPNSGSWNAFANRTITGGWNTGYSAEAYAMIGGYENLRAGEDLTIGERISMVRGDGNYPNLETIGTVPTRTESSPRRFINEIIRNKSAYDGFGEGPDEQRIRDMPLTDLMSEISDFARISDDNRATFAGEADMFYGWCLSASPTRQDAREMVKRVMRSAGYREGDYTFSGDKLIVTNWDNVTTNLNAYRTQFDRAQRPNRKLIIGGWKRPDLRTTVMT